MAKIGEIVEWESGHYGRPVYGRVTGSDSLERIHVIDEFENKWIIPKGDIKVLTAQEIFQARNRGTRLNKL